MIHEIACNLMHRTFIEPTISRLHGEKKTTGRGYIVGITFQPSFELSISNLEAYMRYECAVHLEEINNLGVVIP